MLALLLQITLSLSFAASIRAEHDQNSTTARNGAKSWFLTTSPLVHNTSLKNGRLRRIASPNHNSIEGTQVKLEKFLESEAGKLYNDLNGKGGERKARGAETAGNTDSQVPEYINEESEVKELILKHYTMFDQNYFYPAWTYDGFYSPSLWHEVNIDFFTYSDNFTSAAELKRRKSFMHLCSEKVLETVDKPDEHQKLQYCYSRMENRCRSNRPSPINILTPEAEENENFGPFAFENYDNFYAFRMFLPPDGTDILTLRFWIPAALAAVEGGKEIGMPKIKKGPLGHNELYLDRILFHVGSNRLIGSEHTLDDVAYGMEIQLFFSTKNTHYWEALAQYVFMDKDDPDSMIGKNVHVLSVLVNVARAGDKHPPVPDAQFANNFDIISSCAEMFWRAKNTEKKRAVQFNYKKISLEDFLDAPTSGPYYTYEGSLTHPPCLEHVGWSVFEKPIWITYEQWTKFAFIHSEFSDKRYLAGNFRPQEYISVDVDLDTYLDMREVEGEGEIEEKDMEIALEQAGSKKNLRFIVRYHLYELYYAQKVQKSTVETSKKMEWDYYEDGDDDSSIILASVWTILLGLILAFLNNYNNIT